MEHLANITKFANDLSLGEVRDLPLFCNASGNTVSKVRMVETFEAIATMCGQELLSSDGLRLFGGHTVRVTGAQSLAACGVEVAKLRILARHSGDSIMRYVAEAPLTALRADLGLVTAAGGASGSAVENPVGCTAKQAKQLKKALRTMRDHEERITALQTIVAKPPVAIYVENVTSQVLHAMRPGGGSHTMCGWHVGTKTTARTGVRYTDTVQGTPWWQVCDRCMPAERNAARIVAAADEQPMSD